MLGPISLYPLFLDTAAALPDEDPILFGPPETDEERADMLDVEVWGREVTIFEEGNPGFAPFTLVGIWDRDHELLDLGDDVAVSSRRPQLLVRSSDVPPLDFDAQDFRMTVDGDTFRIDDVEHDGTGLAVLRLHRVT